MYSRIPMHRPARQHGAILVVSLLLLLVMTVLALGASQATRMDERMAGNARNHELAFQSAEAGLRAGERLVDDSALTSAPYPCAEVGCGVYENGFLTVDFSYQDIDWWNDNAEDYAASDQISEAASGFSGRDARADVLCRGTRGSHRYADHSAYRAASEPHVLPDHLQRRRRH